MRARTNYKTTVFKGFATDLLPVTPNKTISWGNKYDFDDSVGVNGRSRPGKTVSERRFCILIKDSDEMYMQMHSFAKAIKIALKAKSYE